MISKVFSSALAQERKTMAACGMAKKTANGLTRIAMAKSIALIVRYSLFLTPTLSDILMRYQYEANTEAIIMGSGRTTRE